MVFSCKKKYSSLVDGMCCMVHCRCSNTKILIKMVIYFNAHDGSRIGRVTHLIFYHILAVGLDISSLYDCFHVDALDSGGCHQSPPYSTF